MDNVEKEISYKAIGLRTYGKEEVPQSATCKLENQEKLLV